MQIFGQHETKTLLQLSIKYLVEYYYIVFVILKKINVCGCAHNMRWAVFEKVTCVRSEKDVLGFRIMKWVIWQCSECEVRASSSNCVRKLLLQFEGKAFPSLWAMEFETHEHLF